MEVDEIQRSQVCKFQRISSNDNSSNPNKIGTQKANHQYLHEDGVGGGGGGGGGGVGRLCGWPSSRIVRVSRASGGKDRHSKVLTSKGLRDRRVRLSVTTAIQFYDLQDRLGYDQPSKAVEWLIKAASSSISELPSLDPSFNDCNDVASLNNNNINININNNISMSKSSACSSTSETSKGNDVVSRSENRVKARERAREMAAKKEKEKENDVVSLNRVNNCISQNSSFTDLLTGGSATVSTNNNSPESRIHWTTTTTPMDYFFNRPPQFNITAGENYNFAPAGESYNLNFSIASSSSSGGGGGFASGFNRGTLQSNLLSVSPHHHHHNLQRFQSSSMVDGSTSTNFPFFVGPNIGSTAPEHFPATAGYGGADRKEKSKN